MEINKLLLLASSRNLFYFKYIKRAFFLRIDENSTKIQGILFVIYAEDLAYVWRRKSWVDTSSTNSSSPS